MSQILAQISIPLLFEAPSFRTGGTFRKSKTNLSRTDGGRTSRYQPRGGGNTKAKQSKRNLDEGSGRSLYALQITYNIICTKCTLLI